LYYRSFLYVLTTRVTVCLCHTEIKGHLLTLASTSHLLSALINGSCNCFGRTFMFLRSAKVSELDSWSSGSLTSVVQRDSCSCGPFVLLVSGDVSWFCHFATLCCLYSAIL